MRRCSRSKVSFAIQMCIRISICPYCKFLLSNRKRKCGSIFCWFFAALRDHAFFSTPLPASFTGLVWCSFTPCNLSFLHIAIFLRLQHCVFQNYKFHSASTADFFKVTEDFFGWVTMFSLLPVLYKDWKGGDVVSMEQFGSVFVQL